MLYDYSANPGCPGGFSELTVKAGTYMHAGYSGGFHSLSPYFRSNSGAFGRAAGQ